MCRQTYIISTRSTFEVVLFYNTYSHTITISHGIIFVKIITLFFNDTPPRKGGDAYELASITFLIEGRSKNEKQ